MFSKFPNFPIFQKFTIFCNIFLKYFLYISGQFLWLFLTCRCLIGKILLISMPEITLSILKEIKENHSCWQVDIYASGSQKEIVIFIITPFTSINLFHYCRNYFDKLFFHWVYYEIWISRYFQSPIPKDFCYSLLK